MQRYYREEIEFHRLHSLKRPEEIINNIRTLAFPNRKIALQQSLAASDEAGDGYITCIQFIDAIYRADLKIERDQLELLFEVISERFDDPIAKDKNVPPQKYLNLPFFYSKLFRQNETSAIQEVDLTLQSIKAALIYKGVDFGIIFAEQNEDD
jgi:MoxR-like ATPase